MRDTIVKRVELEFGQWYRYNKPANEIFVQNEARQIQSNVMYNKNISIIKIRKYNIIIKFHKLKYNVIKIKNNR